MQLDLSDPANPVAAGSATDGVGGFTELYRGGGIEIFTHNGVPHAIVLGHDDNGFQIVELALV